MPNFSPWFRDSSSVVEGASTISGYQIDRLLYLLSDPQPMSIRGVAYHGVAPHYDGDGVYDVDEKTAVLVRFSNGISFTFEVGWISNLGDISEGCSIFESTNSLPQRKAVCRS